MKPLNSLHNTDKSSSKGFSGKKSFKKKAKKRYSKRRFKTFVDLSLLTNFNLPPVGPKHEYHDLRSRVGQFKLRQSLNLIQRIPAILSSLYDVPLSDVSEAYRELVWEVDHRIRHKGFVQTMVWLKAIHGYYVRFMSNHFGDPIPDNRTDRDGLLLVIPTINSFARMEVVPGSPNYRSLVSSILQFFRIWEPRGDKPDTASVVEPFPLPISDKPTYIGAMFEEISNSLDVSSLPYNLDKYILEYRKTVKGMFPSRLANERRESIKSMTSIHLSTKNGPNGPSVPSAPLDFNLIKNSELYKPITEWIYLNNNKSLKRLLWWCRLSPFSFEQLSRRSPCLSKICEKVEVGGKVRLFAVLDHITQSCFTGLHKHLFNKVLRRISEDGTFDHNLAALKARSYTVHGLKSEEMNSVDLSTATDRLPVLLQAEIINQIYGDYKYGDLWKVILTSRDFQYSGHPLRYMVGQPMGALSSWAMLAVTHHCIVRSCFRYFKRNYRGNYLVIGDDVVIVGDDVARLYEFIMKDILHVPISKTKGYSSQTLSGRNPLSLDTIDHSVVEIAKRVFYNGYEITGISPNILIDIIRQPSSVIGASKLICNKLSHEERPFKLPWKFVETLSKCSFKGIEVAQMLTLFSSEALSTRSGGVSLDQIIDDYKCPWAGDPYMISQVQESLSLSMVNNLSRKVFDSLNQLFEFTSSSYWSKNSNTYVSKGFSVSFGFYKYLFRELSKSMNNYLIDTIEQLKVSPLTWDSPVELVDLISKLESIHDFSRILAGSEINRKPIRQRLNQGLKALFSDSLRGISLVETLRRGDWIREEVIAQQNESNLPIQEDIITIEWDDELQDFVKKKQSG